MNVSGSPDVSENNAPNTGSVGFATDPALWRALMSAKNDPYTFSAAWINLFCNQLNFAFEQTLMTKEVVGHGFVALHKAGEDNYTRTGQYGNQETGVILAKLSERALHLRRPIIQNEQGPGMPCHIACPIIADNQLLGIVGFELTSRATPHLDAIMRFIQWGLVWFQTLGSSEKNNDYASVLAECMEAINSGRSAETITEVLCALLVRHYNCERVSIGCSPQQTIKLVGTSSGKLSKQTNDFIAAIQAAQEEALASQETTTCFPPPETQSTALGAHQRLCRSHRMDWAISITHTDTFDGGGVIYSVATFEGVEPQPSPEVQLKFKHLIALLLPLISARVRAERSMRAHGKENLWLLWRRHFSLPTTRHRLIAGALFLTCAAMLFLKGDYEISASASLEGQVKRVIVAPFDGYIADAIARPGDSVKKGALLARLDDRDLRLQELDLDGRISEIRRQIDQAMGLRDIANVNILTARLKQYQADWTLVEENLKRISLTAPFNAVVVSGDPGNSIGAPVRRGEVIYEVSPLNAYRVALLIPQDAFADVKIGFEGKLVLSSLPYDQWPIRIERITPTVKTKDGKTVFRVEATLLEKGDVLRPGMQGIAHVNAGRRNLVWIYTHRAAAWLRLKMWEFLP